MNILRKNKRYYVVKLDESSFSVGLFQYIFASFYHRFVTRLPFRCLGSYVR